MIRSARMIIILTGLMLFSGMISGQDSTVILSETFKKENREIDLARITLESTEIVFSLTKELNQSISEKKLNDQEVETIVFTGEIDSILKNSRDTFLELKNMRAIRNHLNFWKRKLSELQVVENRISGLNMELDKNRLKHAREKVAWTEIRSVASDYNYGPAVKGRIDNVIGLLDSAINNYSKKSEATFLMLDLLNSAKISINEKIEKYDALLVSKQKNIYRSGHPGLFSLNFSNSENWMIREAFNTLHKGEFLALGEYFRKHLFTLVLHMVLLILAIVFLVYLKRYGIPEGEHEDANFRQSLKIIISNPGNSALILILFASIVLYPNRPVLFSDLFKLVVSIPLTVTLINMAHRKYWGIIIAFEALVILQIINANLPTNLIPARLLLLLTSFIEILTLSAFIIKLKQGQWNNKSMLNLVLTLCYIHLVIAAASLFTNLVGKVLLTQALINAVSGTALALVLIVMAMLVGNGLVMILIDSKISNYINFIRKRRYYLKEEVTKLFKAVAGIFMALYILEAYGIDIYLADWFTEFIHKERNIGSVAFTWGQIFTFFLVIWVSVYLSKLLRIFLEEEILDRMNLSKGMPNTIALLFRYTVITLALVAAASAAGIKWNNLTIILGALSVGIGFGLQNIFNNLVSGLILLLERPIKIGDTIEVGPLIGIVKSIGIRASNVQTVDGAEIIVPNGNLVSNEVINWTLNDKRRRIEILAGVAYSSDPHQVHSLCVKILEEHPEVVKSPSPIVLFNNLGESSLEFRLLFWTENFDEWIRIRSEVMFSIYITFKKEGIVIPFPQRDINIKSMPHEPEKKDEQPTN